MLENSRRYIIKERDRCEPINRKVLRKRSRMVPGRDGHTAEVESEKKASASKCLLKRRVHSWSRRMGARTYKCSHVLRRWLVEVSFAGLVSSCITHFPPRSAHSSAHKLYLSHARILSPKKKNIVHKSLTLRTSTGQADEENTIRQTIVRRARMK